mmetsp:Transcript_4432/g.9686  ORF Transcript_4432/g.9686 Transcript_4432/m.9686 type:complete len:227 (+) Transcript_4432:20-700(+)
MGYRALCFANAVQVSFGSRKGLGALFLSVCKVSCFIGALLLVRTVLFFHAAFRSELALAASALRHRCCVCGFRIRLVSTARPRRRRVPAPGCDGLACVCASPVDARALRGSRPRQRRSRRRGGHSAREATADAADAPLPALRGRMRRRMHQHRHRDCARVRLCSGKLAHGLAGPHGGILVDDALWPAVRAIPGVLRASGQRGGLSDDADGLRPLRPVQMEAHRLPT